MSRKSNTEERRAQIVHALLAVVAEQGYEKATIQAIARQADLTPGLIHYHFKTKEEILLHLVATLVELSHARFADCARSAVTPREKLDAYIHARLATGKGANPDAVAAWVVIGAEAVRQPEVRAVYQSAVATELKLVRTLLEGCLAERRKRVGSAAKVAAAIVALIEGAFQLASATNDIMPKGYAAGAALQLIDRFISGEADA